MATVHEANKAVWESDSRPTKFSELSGDIEVDVAIVGGGITGISTAYRLLQEGKTVAVLEARKIGMGTSGSSTGNLYASTDEHLHKIASAHDDETMRKVASSRKAAVDFIEARIKEFNIDCEFERVPFYLFTTHDDNSRSGEVEKELDAVKKAGLPATGSAPENFPYKVSTITNLPDQAQFNPLKYVQELAVAISKNTKCQIYENSVVEKIEDGSPCLVHTEKGKVKAKKVVQATHSPKGVYAVHTAMEVYREHALAVRLKGNLPPAGIYWHLAEKQLYSVRPYKNKNGRFLLVLDASHKLGHIMETEESFKKVEKYLETHFEVDKIEFVWAAQNYKAADKIPYIGTSPMENNVFIATGFAADGLTYGTLSAMIISDEIIGKENPWAKTYDPKRFTPQASAKRFIKENMDVTTHLLKDYIFKGTEKELEDVKNGEGRIVEIENKKMGAFRDEQGAIHLVSAVCTHMGCQVHWNNGEKSWDCPCHGSRFSIDGEVLEGPAINRLARPGEDRPNEGLSESWDKK